MGLLAELSEGVFELRLEDGDRVDADFALTVRTPEGTERWDFGFNHRDVVLEPARGRSPREQFEPLMRSLFDDHLSDLRERGLTADRTFDELPVRLEVPDEVLRRLAR